MEWVKDKLRLSEHEHSQSGGNRVENGFQKNSME